MCKFAAVQGKLRKITVAEGKSGLGFFAVTVDKEGIWDIFAYEELK